VKGREGLLAAVRRVTVFLWFELDDFDAAVMRAEEMKAEIFKPRHRSENAHWECWLHDLDGYTIVLASPHGSAG